MLVQLLSLLLLCILPITTLDLRAGQPFQIILNGVPDLSAGPLAPDVPIYDIDLEDADAATIAGLKALGKFVICYFSAGTYENWRTDANTFPASDLGKALPEWPDERWLRVSSGKIRDIMVRRIQTAKAKGCDAIDPDNTDGYTNDNGLSLSKADTVNYVKFLATTAKTNGLKIGLKNTMEALPELSNDVHFAVNEQCAEHNECAMYTTFLGTGKPVFHIEYPKFIDNMTEAERRFNCAEGVVSNLSTVIKYKLLNGFVAYCDGTNATTNTRPPGTPHPIPTTVTRISSTSSTSSRSRTTPTSVSTKVSTTTTTSVQTTSSVRTSTRTSTSARPTTSSPPGCRQKHWDQCGGNDWKGCTVCESGFSCKPVSPPWYYQCL